MFNLMWWLMVDVSFDITAFKSLSAYEYSSYQGLNKYGTTWPPTGTPEVLGSAWVGSNKYDATHYAITRRYISFDLTALIEVPSSAELEMYASDLTAGADQSFRVYFNNWGGGTVTAADWGDLSFPAGDAVAGPFEVDVYYSFPVDPAGLVLGEMNYFEFVGVDVTTEPAQDATNLGAFFYPNVLRVFP